MKLKPRIVCAALLAVAAAPAWALQLGQIEVKSALNQPLVAAIPLHPENLTELDGLTVSLAPAADFSQAGLQITPTDQTLRFNVTTDNNGQKLVLVTSTQPITDPYLDFLVQVSTRQGKQVREFVVLLNPVIAAPAPEVQTAPVAGAPAAPVQAPAELPPASAFPQPAPPAAQPAAKVARQPASKPAPAPAKPATPPPASVAKPQAATASAQAGGSIRVERGDSLYVIAKRETEGKRGVINQMMLALKSANPDAFFKDNINDLKTGAILRIPTRDEIDQTSVAAANAEVHRQYEAWRAARPQAATVVAGTAVQAAANAAPKPGKAGPASDHLALTPPTGAGGAAENRPGVAGGTGKETVAGLQQQLQNDRGALVSLEQSNADLESRSRSLKDIAAKSDKLLSLKDATVAELQHKLAEVQSGKAGAAGSASALASAGPAASRAVAKATASAKPEHKSPAPSPTPTQEAAWFNRPLTWIVAGLVVLALVLISLSRKRRKAGAASVARGPLSDPADVAVPQSDELAYELSLRADLEENPGKLSTYLKLCRLYNSREDEQGFIEVAKAMREHVTDLHCAEWTEVAAMGEELAPHLPLFELPAVAPPNAFAGVALQLPFQRGETFEAAPVAPAPEHEFVGNASHEVEPAAPAAVESEQPEADAAVALGDEPDFADDPVDTKLDLARAYLDMGDPVGARAMLEEVIEEGSQTQKDEAKRLLADVAG